MQLQRKVIFEVALLGSLLFFCLLLFLTLAVADDPVVTVTVGDIEVPPGGVVRAPIMVQNVTALGGGVINITFNSSVIHVTGVTEGGGNALTIGAWNSNNSLNPGSVRIAAYSTWLPGQSGDVTFAYITFSAVGAVDSTSSLNLSVESLFTIRYVEISNTARNGTIAIAETNVTGIDTGPGTYPSIGGIYQGTIIPNRQIKVSKLYTYPSPGTGGHAEYARLWDDSGLNATASWSGYERDWSVLFFDHPFILEAGQTYYYELGSSSYPQVIHSSTHTSLDGSFISCTAFTAPDGHVHEDWIPAVRLYNKAEAGGP
jgi:hypothetical protein